MSMNYVDINQLISADGLRLVLVQGTPSPWGQAAKAMMEFKNLKFITGAQQPGAENAELVAWSGVNSGPVVAWNDEQPLNRWDDILYLLERLAPQKPLLPQEPAQRVQLFGLAHEICGELGLGWNCRLNMVRSRIAPGESPRGIAAKYGFNEADAALASSRIIAFMKLLAETLKAQLSEGSNYLIGQSATAADFYWAAFSNLVAIQPPEDCPLDPAVRPIFENTPEEVSAALDPVLLEHREHIMQTYFKIPMEF